jgi:PAS domain S-box-containing protein
MFNKNQVEPVKKESNLQKEAKAIDVSGNELLQKEAYTSYLAAIVESSDDAIISKSLQGKITSWNKGSEKMFGYTAVEAVGKPITMLIPSTLLNEEKNILERICNNESIDHFETVRKKKNGDQFYVSLTVSPLKDKAGAIIGISKIARDITSRKKYEADFVHINKELLFQNAEKEQRAAELVIANKELAFQNAEKEKRAAELAIANKELILQNAEKEKRAAELVIANKELAFQNAEKEKRAAELAIANKELILQNAEKEKRAAELVVANKELAFQNGEKEKRAAELAVANNELIFQNDEKERRAAELVIANKELIFQSEEKENRAAELVVANHELSFQNEEKEKRAEELVTAIADLKTSQEHISEVNKELESFSYSVSHDLRAPLRAINGYTNMLQTNFKTQLDPEANRLMNNIVQNAKKMGFLIDDLLTFSRIGRRELVKINISMNPLLQQICDELKAEEPHRNIEFHIDNLSPALADNMAIKQVWLNLVSNAIKYTRLKETAIIEISSVTDREEVTYSIKDNGVGFDMRYAHKLFGVFQRLHSEEEFEGTGVGLALVQRIITKHGGYIRAEAKVNEGATFYFTLHKP